MCLKKHYSKASITVHSDLLAPIHVNQSQAGYYAILGTGSVGCFMMVNPSTYSDHL